MHTREVLATLINVNKSKKGKNMKGKDIIKLSFDEADENKSKHFYNAIKWMFDGDNR